MNAAPVLIMAGGTGGHIFPGIAVAKELMARAVPVLWLGSEGGLETKLVPQAGIELKTIAISGVRGKGIASLLGAPLKILRAVIAAWKLIGAARPRSVLSMGGYVAGPGGIAAWLRGVPLVVHEQNSIAGTTNRILAKFAKRRLCGFEGALPRSEWIGNPVRAEIAALPPPETRFMGRSGKSRLLVLGGSQGARALNRRVPWALGEFDQQFLPEVRHQCGMGNEEQTRNNYAEAKVEAVVEPFIGDMAAAYGWADLVVCRAGALTIAELSAAGVASILVPFPHAVDDHQTRNAEEMERASASLLLQEEDAGVDVVGTFVGNLLQDRQKLLAMAQAARSLAKPKATANIADICQAVAA